MKVKSLGEAKAGLSAVVDEAQSERVLITGHGKPAAVIIGVEGEDLEDLMTRANPKFWAMIEERRASRQRPITLEDLERQYVSDSGATGRRKKTAR